jgi:hypothetical protein
MMMFLWKKSKPKNQIPYHPSLRQTTLSLIECGVHQIRGIVMQLCFLRSCIGVLVFAAAVSAPAHAEIYRWVDENGVVNYSDKPPKGVKVEEKSYQNIATKFREPPKDLYRKEAPVEEVAVEAPAVDTAPAQSDNTQAKDDSSKDGTLSRKDAVKYNDTDKETLSERKSSINSGGSASSGASSSISDTKKSITSEYKKAKEAYKNRNENL